MRIYYMEWCFLGLILFKIFNKKSGNDAAYSLAEFFGKCLYFEKLSKDRWKKDCLENIW